MIGEVNCESQSKTCSAEGVSSHPTLVGKVRAVHEVGVSRLIACATTAAASATAITNIIVGLRFQIKYTQEEMKKEFPVRHFVCVRIKRA